MCRDAVRAGALLSPVDIATEAARRALADTEATQDPRRAVDHLCVVRFSEDSVRGHDFWANPFGRSDNVPWSVASRLALRPQQLVYAEVGGHSPQRLVNRLCERIQVGDVRLAVVTGGEAIATIREATRAGLELDWRETHDGDFIDAWDDKPLTSDDERRHGLFLPMHVYALLEQARRHERGLSLAAYRAEIGRLFAPFSGYAAGNPYAQFPIARDPENLSEIAPDNYLVCEPYSKWMVAQDAVNQGAAVVLTSAGTARELGIAESRWVYLRAYGDADDRVVTERPRLATSSAQGQALRVALDYAGLAAGDLAHLDLYSCFPIAVWSACEHLGLNPSDQALTVTGGLPFFGGPGNNYSMHGIAEVMSRIRAAPHSHGMVAANGGYLSKHSVGIYSGRVPNGARAAAPPNPLPPPVRVTARATGAARIESVAAIYKKSVPESGVMIGRLDDDSRILALPVDSQALAALFRDEVCGQRVVITHRENMNYFNLE